MPDEGFISWTSDPRRDVGVAAMSGRDPALLPGYQLRLPTFEGPLDVLLRLIERDQLAITEISLVTVTDQFLAYMERLGEAQLDVVAEFATVAARLILLKSRTLLPRPAAPTEAEPDPDDLVRQLSEYQRFQEAALVLADRDSRGIGAFARGTAVVIPAPVALPPLAPQQPNALTRALRRRFSSIGPDVQVIAERPIVTLREIVARALGLVTTQGRFRFQDVLSTRADRQEVLTAFLAMLVLVRRRVVDAHQAEPFGEIVLEPTADGGRAFSNGSTALDAGDGGRSE